MRAIIPCAGFGTRVGMKPNESKEMLSYNDNKLIDFSLAICKLYDLKPLVITRKEKTDLNEYLKEQNVEMIEIDVEGEWAESVLKSQGHWEEKNILILPDTRFKIEPAIGQIVTSLDLGAKSVFALHKVDDPQNWGIINNYTLYEKNDKIIGYNYAWGIIGFNNKEGIHLFESINKFKEAELLDSSFIYLDYFKDVTRSS